MLRTDPLLLATPLVFALAALGCKPEIGDECTVGTDCSAAGERLCDTSQPGGYCTIFNCEPGTCPEEAICVLFGGSLSRAPSCFDPQRGSRFQETYCVKSCESDDDCRGGYACIDMNAANPGAVRVVEHGSVDGRVCVVPYSALPVPDDRSTEVCTGTKTDFKVPDAGSSDTGSETSTDTGSDVLPDVQTDGDAAGDAAAE